MAKKIIQAQMQQRRDTAAQWAAKNPVLLDGELGLVTDNPNSYKMGDGVTAWNDLPLRGFDGNIVQELGDSATSVMSQKAITEQVAGQNAKLAQLDQKVQEDIAKIKPIVINGNVVNAADEEDITSEDNLLKLKDRDDALGMGYVILRKNKAFAEQVTKENTIYEIRYDYNLTGAEVAMPANCILRFNGGKITNGVLDLQNAFIEGRGIDCYVKNPNRENRDLSLYIYDSSDYAKNTLVLQALLDAGVSVVFNTDITLAAEISVPNYCELYSENYSSLNFPDSRGFVFDNADYLQNCVFKGFRLHAKGHCFDLCNSNQGEYPKSIYFIKFSDLNCYSLEGHCFNGGHGRGYNSTTEPIIFNSEFNNIGVNAKKGCGFVGCYGIVLNFINCKDYGCGEAVFHNCAGYIEGFNGTFGIPRTPVFYRTTGDPDGIYKTYRVHLVASNVESFSGKIFDCANSGICGHFITLQSNIFFITPNNGNLIEYYPFDFDILMYLSMKNCTLERLGTYANNYTDIKVINKDYLSIDPSSQKINIYNLSWGVREFDAQNITIGSGLLSSSWNNVTFTKFANLEVGLIKADLLMYARKEILVDNNSSGEFVPNLSKGKFFTIKAVKDDEGGLIQSLYPYNDDYARSEQPIEIFIQNGCAKTNIILEHNYAVAARYVSETGANITLTPGQVARCIILPQNTGISDQGIRIFIYKPYDMTYRTSGTTAQRPATAEVGFRYFDTTLSKPIWWTGDKWVDATGVAV